MGGSIFCKMKSQFPELSGRKQEPNVHCHITSGCWFICKRKQERNGEREKREWQRWGEGALHWPAQAVCISPPLPHNDVGKDSLCIGLINSYSSSARHPGNRSGFALGLIFRPVEDSQSIRALFRLQTANFLDLPKKWGEARENERVTEEGVDDIEREMERR